MKAPAHIHRLACDGPGAPSAAAPEKVRAGSGAATLWNTFTDAAGRFHIGHWRGAPGVLEVAYTETELCVLLAGSVRLTGPDGAVEFGPGEAFVIEGGFAGTWESLGEVTKIYAILEP